MITKFVVNILCLISISHTTRADYGVDDIQSYRLNTDVKRFPVRSPDKLFGFEVSENVEQKMIVKKNNNNNNINNNKQNINQNQNNVNNNYNNDYEEYLDQNNVLREPSIPSKKKVQKNRLKTSYRKPIVPKPMKMIFSQYLSPQLLESDDSYPLNPSDTFDDQYLSQLMPQIMSTAEQMVLKHEEQVRQYSHPMIPAAQLLEYLRSSQFFTFNDDPYGVKRSDKNSNLY